MNEFTIKIEAPELARAITNLASALGILCVTVEEQGANKPASTGSNNNGGEPPRPGSRPTSSASDTALPKHERSASERVERESSSAVTHHTIEEVRAAFSEYAKAKGKDKAKELLLKYGAAKVTELKAEDYDAAIRDIREC